MPSGKIQNEEQYQKTLEWLRKKAIELEDPLLDGDKKAALMVKYDAWCVEIDLYKRQVIGEQLPYMKRHYEEIERKQARKPNVPDWLKDE